MIRDKRTDFFGFWRQGKKKRVFDREDKGTVLKTS